MKPAGKVALLGLGILGAIGLPAFLMTGNIRAFLPGSTKLSPEEEKRLQGTVLGPIASGNQRGRYG